MTCQPQVDAKLQGYLFAQAVADGERINWNDILTHADPCELVVGLALTVGVLRNLIANDNGLSLAQVDEQLIGVLSLEGGFS